MLFSAIIALLTILPATFATPVSISSTSTPLPVIIWHGLGDRSDNDGIRSVAALVSKVYPGTKTHIISLGETGASDQRASFFGNLTTQLLSVCEQLSSNPSFGAKYTRVDALGFSQGGLFLRGLLERCPTVRVRSLVTFGSPHNGIYDLPKCGTYDLLCKGAEGAVRSNKWSDFAQGNIVPAQYFRETDDVTGLGSEDYLERSGFLADVNNEREVKNAKYRGRLAGLEKFVMYMFENDTTVMPAETAWFADKNATSGDVTAMRDRVLYKQDWLGLKALDDKGGIVLRNIKDAGHMQFSNKLLRSTCKEFFGPERDELETLHSDEPTNFPEAANSAWQDVSLVGGDW